MTTKILRVGDATKANPYTICIVSNPVLERPDGGGTFVADPIVQSQAAFDACAAYVETSLFGGLPGQRERLLADPSIGPRIRVVSVFVPPGSPLNDANSLVGEDPLSNQVVARRVPIKAFLARYGIAADVAFAVTASPTHTRATAWYTSDDASRPGVPFVVDGAGYTHRYFPSIPGTVALPVTSTSLTAVHEFGHAASSYTDGAVVDLYVDSPPGLNCKVGRPIPAQFGAYQGVVFPSDATRGGLGYPPSWRSYHPGLQATNVPAVMDDYWKAPTGNPLDCRHDTVTHAFLRDRLLAKLSR